MKRKRDGSGIFTLSAVRHGTHISTKITYLLKGVLLRVFSTLEDSDLTAVIEVCQEWRACYRHAAVIYGKHALKHSMSHLLGRNRRSFTIVKPFQVFNFFSKMKLMPKKDRRFHCKNCSMINGSQHGADWIMKCS